MSTLKLSRTSNLVLAMIVGAAVLGTAIPQIAVAEATPTAGSQDPRVRYITHTEGQVYTVNTRLRSVTLIELDPGERILTVSAGDTHSFLIEEIGNQQSFTIKPLVAGARTNAVVETNRSYYFLDLRENSNATAFFSVRIGSGNNGRRGRTAVQTVPAASPLSYALTSDGSSQPFAPIRVWDDGRLTHFSFPADAPIPAIFRADSEGREHAVNTRANGTTVTVTSRSERWVLRFGDAAICIEGKAVNNG